MKKLTSLFILIISISAFAQIGTRIPSSKIGGENSKWTLGGNAGIGGAFGSGGGGTTIYIIPRVGYKVTNDFEAGVSGNFSLNNSRFFSSTMLGIGPFANYYFGRSAYLSGLFQHYFINSKDKITNYKFTDGESALFLGGGYMQKLGQNTYMQIGAMYNVLYNKNNSVFGGGFVPNVGIVYGL